MAPSTSQAKRTTDMTATNGELLTIREVAARLKTPEATLRYWRHIKTGPPSFKIGRRVMYDADALEAWVQTRRGTLLHLTPRQGPTPKQSEVLTASERQLLLASFRDGVGHRHGAPETADPADKWRCTATFLVGSSNDAGRLEAALQELPWLEEYEIPLFVKRITHADLMKKKNGDSSWDGN